MVSRRGGKSCCTIKRKWERHFNFLSEKKNAPVERELTLSVRRKGGGGGSTLKLKSKEAVSRQNLSERKVLKQRRLRVGRKRGGPRSKRKKKEAVLGWKEKAISCRKGGKERGREKWDFAQLGYSWSTKDSTPIGRCCYRAGEGMHGKEVFPQRGRSLYRERRRKTEKSPLRNRRKRGMSLDRRGWAELYPET